MLNATTQDYISVTSNLTISRGWYQVILNYRDKNNKRIQKWKSLRIKAIPGNKKKAEREQKIVEREFEKELNVPPQDTKSNKTDILYGDYILNTWLPYIKDSIELTSYSGYENKVKIIAKYFNDLEIKLVDLKRIHIRDFYTYLKQTRNIKKQTINRYHANIHKSLEDAIEFELIEVNPSNGLRKKAEQYIPSYYKQEELEQLFKVAHSTKSLIELHILITAYYGFRREECVGLKWSAIDFKAHTITVSHTVTHATINGKYAIVKKDRCKNKTSNRTLPLIPFIEEKLKEEYKRQQQNKKIFGNTYKNNENYILVDDEGELIRPDRVSRHFSKLIKDNNLRKIELRQLRHSCATLLLANRCTFRPNTSMVADIQIFILHKYMLIVKF